MKTVVIILAIFTAISVAGLRLLNKMAKSAEEITEIMYGGYRD